MLFHLLSLLLDNCSKLYRDLRCRCICLLDTRCRHPHLSVALPCYSCQWHIFYTRFSQLHCCKNLCRIVSNQWHVHYHLLTTCQLSTVYSYCQLPRQVDLTICQWSMVCNLLVILMQYYCCTVQHDIVCIRFDQCRRCTFLFHSFDISLWFLILWQHRMLRKDT